LNSSDPRWGNLSGLQQITSLRFRSEIELPMTTVSAFEAKTHLPRLLRAAERGETVIITRHGKPVAQLGRSRSQGGARTSLRLSNG
jgi:hypothetical protein